MGSHDAVTQVLVASSGALVLNFPKLQGHSEPQEDEGAWSFSWHLGGVTVSPASLLHPNPGGWSAEISVEHDPHPSFSVPCFTSFPSLVAINPPRVPHSMAPALHSTHKSGVWSAKSRRPTHESVFYSLWHLCSESLDSACEDLRPRGVVWLAHTCVRSGIFTSVPLTPLPSAPAPEEKTS